MADRTTAIAIFEDRAQAQRAIEQLKRAGFTEKEIGVTARDTGEADGDVVDRGKGTHAKEGAIAGVAAGAGVGALWGLGILAGVLPGIGTAVPARRWQRFCRARQPAPLPRGLRAR